MLGRMRAGPRWEIAALMLIATALACGRSAAPATQTPVPPAATTAPAAVTQTPDEAVPAPAAVGECADPATEIELGIPISAEVSGHNQPPPEKMYFCVLVPDGVSGLSFELTETEAALNLFVGYPDLDTVQNGGFTFWASDEPGAHDKTVLVKPALTDYVQAGSYYIEVSPADFQTGSPFTLLVRVP